MARISDADVRQVIDTELTELTPFIASAESLFSQVLADKGFDEEHTKWILVWLAAHFISIREPREKSFKIGDASVTFEGTTGMGLRFTRYGQTAIMMDTSGTLAELGQQPARFEVISRGELPRFYNPDSDV